MTKITRRDFIKASGKAAAAITVGKPALSLGTQNQPVNVLLLVSDEHNPRISSLNKIPGYPDWIKTPNMEKLAARGVVFDAAYCPSPLCMPSRSSLLSGKRNHITRAYSNCTVFLDKYNTPEDPEHYLATYGEILSREGVYTAYFGKLDVYSRPEFLGFSEISLAENRPVPGDGHISRNPLKIRDWVGVSAISYGPSENIRANALDDEVIDRAVKWIKSKGKRLNAEHRSWVLSVNINNPHFPHYCSKADWDLYPHPDLPAYGKEEESANHPFAVDHRAYFQNDDPRWTPENIRGNRRGYYGKVTYVDRKLGELMQALSNAGLEENTVVVYTSDHGEMLGKFGMWRKCTLYEDSVTVPLIVAGPGFHKGKRVGTPVDLLDLNATIFKAVNKMSARPNDSVGRPLQELQNEIKDRVVFSEYHGHGKRASHYMLRKGYWKLIYYIGAPHQLFNLKEDPNELHNLAKDNAKKLNELEEEIRKICEPEKENENAEKQIQAQLKYIEAMLQK